MDEPLLIIISRKVRVFFLLCWVLGILDYVLQLQLNFLRYIYIYLEMQNQLCTLCWGSVVELLSHHSWLWLGSTTRTRWSAASTFPLEFCYFITLLFIIFSCLSLSALLVFHDLLKTYQTKCLWNVIGNKLF